MVYYILNEFSYDLDQFITLMTNIIFFKSFKYSINEVFMKNTEIVLASASPRRIEIMKKNGIEPMIMPADVNEVLPEDIGMEEAVMYLALKKALYVENMLFQEDSDLQSEDNSKTVQCVNPYIIAADTVVFKDSIIGKPSDREDAFNILWDLNGKEHYVATGVCILQKGTSIRHCFCEITKVFFKEYTEEEINTYLDTDEPYDKAGAYAIQGYFGKYVDHIEGDLENVIGFPWNRIKEEFNKLNIEL